MRLNKRITWMAWTPEDDELIRQWGAENKSPVRIAARLNRTIQSIKRRSAELGVKLKSRRVEMAEARGRLEKLEDFPSDNI